VGAGATGAAVVVVVGGGAKRTAGTAGTEEEGVAVVVGGGRDGWANEEDVVLAAMAFSNRDGGAPILDDNALDILILSASDNSNPVPMTVVPDVTATGAMRTRFLGRVEIS
jgi:hypothetical protein